jgi:hypothetical protein
MAHLQGNDTSFDPNKFGLKFDKDKPRYDLIPMEILSEIVMAKTQIAYNSNLFTSDFNSTEIYNIITDILFQCGSTESKPIITIRGDFITTNSPLSVVASLMFYILRGKSYSKEELLCCDSSMRWDLIDPVHIERVAGIYTYGANLYQENNWMRVDRVRYFSALCRHFSTIRSKNRFDSESGYLHIYHALWNVIALIWIDRKKSGEAKEEPIVTKRSYTKAKKKKASKK